MYNNNNTNNNNNNSGINNIVNVNNSHHHNSNNNNELPSLLLIDDIMYLRSMRRQIFVIARTAKIPILTIVVVVDKEIAIIRNRKYNINNKNIIPDETITKLYNKFEIPDEKYIFDRNNIIFNNNNNNNNEISPR